MAKLPLASRTIAPPSPFTASSFLWITSSPACCTVRPLYCTSAAISWATAQRGDIVGGGPADEELAGAGARHGHRLVLSVRAGADDGRVADAAVALVRRT